MRFVLMFVITGFASVEYTYGDSEGKFSSSIRFLLNKITLITLTQFS